MEKDLDKAVCLSIAGFDPSGGAGVIVDVKTFDSFGCRPAAAITSITYQNAGGISGASHQNAVALREQVRAVTDEYKVNAVKTGMLPTGEIVEETAHLIGKHSFSNVIVDPVLRSTSGFDLLDAAARKRLATHLFPLALLITPNIPEAEELAGIEILSESDIVSAAKILAEMGPKNVLIKGGHFYDRVKNSEKSISEKHARDYLFDGENLEVFDANFQENAAMRGTGCMLSSAIAANLALGNDLHTAIQNAKNFVNEKIKNR